MKEIAEKAEIAENIVEEVEEKLEKQESEKAKEKIFEEARIKEAIERSKKYSLKDAAYINGTVGFGDNYVSAYAVAMKASSHEIGLLTSLPNLIAPLAGLVTHSFMKKNSRKKIFSISILIQSLIWLPIIGVSFLFLNDIYYAPILLAIFYTIYALFGNFAAPAWMSWIGDLVKSEESGKFFGLRNKIGGLVALVSMILAGIILDSFKKEALIYDNTSLIFVGFGLIFFLAMFFRLLSRHYVLKQHEPELKFEKESYFSFFQFIKRIPKSNYGKFALYVALLTLATNIVGPFYTLYILRDLKFSYIYFMLINISASIATFVFMTKWGKFSDKFGNITAVKISGFFIPIICFLWPVSVLIQMPWKLVFLFAANFFSGFAWSGFNLAAGNFVYDAATSQKRSLCSAYSNILNGFGVVIGTTIGSFLITHLNIEFINIIMFVSVISGILRYAVSFIMLRKIKEVRQIGEKPHWKIVPFASELYNAHLAIRRGVPIPIRMLKNGIFKFKSKFKSKLSSIYA